MKWEETAQYPSPGNGAIVSRLKTVWVVSWYDAGEEPAVTVFCNEENAMKYYNYELENSHAKVAIDECPIYNKFMDYQQNSET